MSTAARALPAGVHWIGDGALRFALGDIAASRSRFEQLRALPGVSDVVLAETHGMVVFAADFDDTHVTSVLQALEHAPDAGEVAAREHVVHVRYDGMDLGHVAERTGLSVPSVIERHARARYVVKSLGFAPGFAYLGDLDTRLVLPRRATPRVRVPRCAVGIAGARTGIYPAEMPGGWHLLGTAIEFAPFDPESGACLQPGDRVRFERVA